MADVNNVICALTGYSKEELLQMHHFDVTYPADRDIDRELINQMLDKQIDTYTIEKRYITRDKKIFLGLLTVSLVWNNDNTPKFFITQVIDITRKKEFEVEMKKKNAELVAAKAKLTAKIKQLEELNGVIVSQLKAPADDINELSKTLQAINVKQKPASVGMLSEALAQERMLERIRESSIAMVSTLDSLVAGRIK
jgi:PAS domain S-box-containing protein